MKWIDKKALTFTGSDYTRMWKFAWVPVETDDGYVSWLQDVLYSYRCRNDVTEAMHPKCYKTAGELDKHWELINTSSY